MKAWADCADYTAKEKGNQVYRCGHCLLLKLLAFGFQGRALDQTLYMTPADLKYLCAHCSLRRSAIDNFRWYAYGTWDR